MKITSVDVWEVVVPTIPGRVHSPEYGPAGWDMMSKHIIRVNTDDGVFGIGETGRGTPRADVDAGIAQVVGRDPLRMPLHFLYHRASAEAPSGHKRDWENTYSVYGGPAYDALEMAIFDLVGKALGVPAYHLLGGAYRTRVPADFWIGHQNPEDAGRSAKMGKERGFHGLKMKCALEEPWDERIQAILDAAGPDFKLTIAPNERFYRPSDFLDLARRLERFPNIAVYEDPFPKWDVDWYRQVRGQVKAALAMHLSDPHALILAIRAGACDCVNLGGSMVHFVRLARMAEAAGMRCWHGSGVDLGIAEHSYLHACSAAPNCTLPSDFVGNWTRQDDLIVEPMRFEEGYAVVPDKPGLGCELDTAALEKYRVK